MPTDMAFVTMSLARTPDEGELLVRALRRLALHGRPIFVTDGGSPADVVAALGQIAGLTLIPQPHRAGLVGQVHTSVSAALSTPVSWLVYTEPDKLGFFEHGVGAFLNAASQDPATSVTLAARSADAFETFPPVQRQHEDAINTLTGAAVGVSGDFSYGPFAMPASLATLVSELDADVGWGWRHYMFAAAARRGYGVRLHEGPFACPPDQGEEDDHERAHRLRQFTQNRRGLELALRGSEPGNGS
ncbi:MAG: hypothetical protein JSU08_14675 [Acidobacteria bacterium]|nr:hypothetical protein [Acidobacteriota bacterium]